jgi:hypothetical protein
MGKSTKYLPKLRAAAIQNKRGHLMERGGPKVFLVEIASAIS